MLTTEAASRIPQSLIPQGVLVITREESGPEEPVVLSRAGKAAQALITLFAVDLWHQPFGIRWSPAYDDGRSNTGDDFAFPKNAVVILVGRRPTEFLKSFIGLAKKRNECRDLVIG
jgi:hypothetical protein